MRMIKSDTSRTLAEDRILSQRSDGSELRTSCDSESKSDPVSAYSGHPFSPKMMEGFSFAKTASRNEADKVELSSICILFVVYRF